MNAQDRRLVDSGNAIGDTPIVLGHPARGSTAIRNPALAEGGVFSHDCAACGGKCLDQRHETPCEGHATCTACAEECAPCSVCGGSGRISDVMPVKDAIADAETLRYGSSEMRLDPAYDYAPVVIATFEAVIGARQCGQRARTLVDGGFWAGVWGYARDAARAAFRAVPGLRGGE